MYDPAERRAFSRIPCRQQVLLDIDGRSNTLTVAGVDVSHGGACLSVPLSAPLAAGSRINVQLPRPDPESSGLSDAVDYFDAKVVRVDRASKLLDGLAIVGLQFS